MTMNSKPSLPTNQTEFITSDQMVTNILVATAIGLVVIAVAVGLGGDNPTTSWILAGAVLIDMGGIALSMRGISMPGRVILPSILTIAAAYIAFNRGGLYHISISAFPVVIVIAGLLLGVRGSFLFAALASIAALIIGYSDINGLNPFSQSSRTGYDDIAVAVTLFTTTAVVLRVIIIRLTESLQEARSFGIAQEIANAELVQLKSELERRVEQRTAELDASNQRNEKRAKQFETIAQVAQTISTTQNLDILLAQITNSISREFGFYHVGVFLLDPRKEYAVLSAANSEGGQKMLERNHRLRVGETGMVGYVTNTGKARVALDTGTDATYFDNPDLPNTRSEIALPLRVGDEIIGALDVQSVEANAFGQEDINILNTLADQVGIAIQNVRQFEATRRALNESEALSRQFVQAGWQQFGKNQNILGIRHTGAKSTLLYRKSRKGRDGEPAPASQEQARARARGASLSLPIKLRGEEIGSVNIRSVANRRFDQDELDIVNAILERAAIAMENARLLAESQKRAAKERAISEIAAKISARSEIEDLLKTAAQELNRTLPGTEIAIQLQGGQERDNA